MSNKTKAERRSRAWAFKGNAQVLEQMILPVDRLVLTHPNRVLQQFRSSNKGKRVA